MKSSNSDQNKEKPKSKKSCSSKQASKFLEKEGFNNFSTNFKGLAVSLSDFIPNQNDVAKTVADLDFDIGTQMKKLEKKDPGTKQKALVDLIDMVNKKDNKSVIGMLRYWPKMYNKLSVDDDKKVRELSQELMRHLSKLCGKSLGTYIKQLLPTWIFSQSDVHGPVAKVATMAFNDTFPDEARRQKAYLLCWEDISAMISASINRIPVKEKNISMLSEKKTLVVNEDTSISIGKKQSSSKEKIVITKEDNKTGSKVKEPILFKEKSATIMKDIEPSTLKPVKATVDAYAEDLVLHLRTLVTLLPYIIHDTTATNDVSKWIHSKSFWAHYTTGAPINIIAIYLNFSIDLLTYAPSLILDIPFVESHIAQALRLVDNYHSAIIPLTWTAIIKCVDILGEKLWHHVSFPNVFLPKWIKMLECGTEGRVSLTASFMLPFFTKLPVDLSSQESVHVYMRLFDSMVKGLSCQRVKNNSTELNCLVTTILECATYTILGARKASNDSLKDKVLSVCWHLLESYLTNPDYSKVDRIPSQFCLVALRPLLNKSVLSSDDVKDVLVDWIERYHGVAMFSEHLAELIMELNRLQISDPNFCVTVMNSVQPVLIQKVVNSQNCLLSYLSVISSQKVTDQFLENQSQLRYVFTHCKNVLSKHSDVIATTIAMAMANILNHLKQEANDLFKVFLSSLSYEQVNIFFTDFYCEFLEQIDQDISRDISTTSGDVWKIRIVSELNHVLSTDLDTFKLEDKVRVQMTLSLVLKLCDKSPLHRVNLPMFIEVVNEFMNRVNDASITADAIDTMVTLAKNLIDHVHEHSTMDLIPRSLILSLTKILLYSTGKDVDLSHVKLYLQHCTKKSHNNENNVFLDIIDQVMHIDNHQQEVGVHLLSTVLEIGLVFQPTKIEDHLHSIILTDMVSLTHIVSRQQRYSITIVHQQQSLLCQLMHKLDLFCSLQVDYPTLINLKTTIDHCCVIVTPILLATFANCHHSSKVLQQCESIYQYTDRLMIHSQNSIIDLMIQTITQTSQSVVFDQCYNLVLLSLKHFIPINYSLWSKDLLALVDNAIDNWTDQTISERYLLAIFQVLVPCAVTARYLVQEIVLATISSLLSEEVKPSIADINRALLLAKSLTLTDSSFFTVCYPLIISVKHIFQSHIDQLYDADMESGSKQFDLSSLLEFLIAGVDSSTSLAHSQWDFILCLISSLSRSTQFINSGDHASLTMSEQIDHIFNSVLLLRLIASVTVAIASVSNESVLDEWDNFYSEPIFRTILDMFSLVSGDHTHGKMVSSDLFTFYTEALAEVVSLCPVTVLLSHNFSSQIHVNDPIELPKDFLVVFNSLLESLSSYSLSTQLAAYNCLLNLTDHLSVLLLDQITKAESNENLESFSITVPHKLLSYLQSDELTQLTVDKLENEIVLTRCFLAWSVVLQLFSCSQAKVRAEISTFLVTHDRCFDRFLSFCYMFMPKSPVVDKKHLTFLAASGRQTCNLIADEPQIFSKCLEKRTKFIIYHLSSYVFRRSLQVLPNLSRGWFMSLDGNSQQQVNAYVRQYLTPEMLKIEFGQLKEAMGNDFDEKLEIQALPVIGEVTVRYIVPGDQCLEQVINVPNNYPIGKISVDFKKEMTVKIPHWKSWIIQMTSTMQNQNGSIVDGVKLWKKNLDNHFDGMEECMICYSILHAVKYILPTVKCNQCKKKFHKDCIYKWFNTSTNPTCPNCRNVFYDGTYKRAQYGDMDM